MNPEANEFQTKKLEKAIIHIGARVADAVELSQKTKELAINSGALLVDLQQELEELYISLHND